MGVADAFKRNKSSKEKGAPKSTSSFNPFDIFLDGTFVRSIGRPPEDIQYIPLTLSEELECEERTAAAVRMLAKAIRYRIDKGLETFESAGLDQSKSIEANVKGLLGELSEPRRESIITAIHIDLAQRLRAFTDFYNSLKEEYVPDDEDGSSRDRNELDSFVMFVNNFRETGYTVADISNMTALQYQAFTMTRYESSVRQANDHTVKSKRLKAKAGSVKPDGKPQRQLVGS